MPSRTLRVLQICGSLPPMACGIGDYTAHLAEALARSDAIAAGVLTSTEARAHQGPFDVLAVVDDWKPAAVPAIVRAVRRWNPDIVHMQFPAMGYGPSYGPWLVPAALSLLRYPVVQTWHEYYPAGSGRRNLLNALTPGGLVAVRPNYLEQMPPWYRRIVSRKHFAMIPNAAALPAVHLSENERRALRERLGAGSRSLIVHFGFMYPAKGTEAVFDIASPEQDHIVLTGALDEADPYHARIRARMASREWQDHVVATGFLPEHDAAAILAAADAVVLPFVDGGGFWNTSVQAAARQGTFVLTTSRERHGFDPETNIAHAAPGDVDAMRQALRDHAGRRVAPAPDDRAAEWRAIAEAHLSIYRKVLGTAA